jgi:enoyl-CoA hydratase/carnithine racemase
VVGFSGLALAPDSAVSLLLPIYIGLGRAKEYFYSNKPITARQAYQWGMVNRVGGFNFQALVRQAAGRLVSGPTAAFAAGKQAFNLAILSNLEETLKFEGSLQDKMGKLDDHREGVAAFFEKRTPKFN